MYFLCACVGYLFAHATGEIIFMFRKRLNLTEASILSRRILGHKVKMNGATKINLPDDIETCTAPEVVPPQSWLSKFYSLFRKEESDTFQSIEFIRQTTKIRSLSQERVKEIYQQNQSIPTGAGSSDETNRSLQSVEDECVKQNIAPSSAVPVAGNGKIATIPEEHENIPSEARIQRDESVLLEYNYEGFTALQTATIDENINLMKLIINYLPQAALNLQAEQKKSGTTSLHLAAKANFVEGIDLLLAHGAPIDTTDKNGYTPLHDAAMQKSTDAVEFLISKGADLKAIAGKSRTTALELVLIKTPKAIDAIKKRLDASIAINDRVENSSKVTLDFDLSPWESKNVTLLHVFSQHNELEHPVMQVLIEENWARVRKSFMFRLCLCIAFLFSLVLYCLLQNKSTTCLIFVLICACCDIFREIGSFLTFACSADAGHFKKNCYQYITSFPNYLDWFCYISVFVFWLGDDDYLKTKLAPLVCLASWFKLISYMGHFEFFSLYNSMYYNVMISFGKVSIAFSLYFVGFVFCFWNYFGSNNVEFENIAFAALKVTGMISGEIDYGGLMASSNSASNNTAESPEKHTMLLGIVVAELFPRFCVAIFVVSVPIVLMNLLTGIVVGDINEMRNAANSNQIKRRVDLIKYITSFKSNYFLNLFGEQRSKVRSKEKFQQEYDFEDSCIPDYLHTAYGIAKSRAKPKLERGRDDCKQTDSHAENTE